MAGKLVIIDHGMSNLNSVYKVMANMHPEVIISSRPEDIEMADKIIIPGIGHFQKAMENLEENKLIDPLNEAVLIRKKPVLGICLGMQLMGRSSSEGHTNGLGWMDGVVVKFIMSTPSNCKIPHLGWNRIIRKKSSLLMDNIGEETEFYFAHSYHWKTDHAEDILAETKYEYLFPAAIERGNIFGVQFHPEKSYDAGIKLLNNFILL